VVNRLRDRAPGTSLSVPRSSNAWGPFVVNLVGADRFRQVISTRCSTDVHICHLQWPSQIALRILTLIEFRGHNQVPQDMMVDT
jgi:hypothetical protein